MLSKQKPKARYQATQKTELNDAVRKDSFLSEQAILQHLPGIVSWRSKDGKYLGCNNNMLKLLGFRSVKSIIGLSHFEIPHNSADYAQIYVDQDKQVLQGNSLTLLNILTFEDGHPKTFVTRKNQFLDTSGDVVGVICNSLHLDNEFLKKSIVRLASVDKKYCTENTYGSYIVGGEYINYSLSPRESECLFYMLRGKTARQTATLLGISHKTVATHIDKIKTKFNCYTKPDLIALALEKGFLFSIPNNLIGNSFVTGA